MATTVAAIMWPDHMPLAIAIPLVLFGLLMMAYALWGMSSKPAYFGVALRSRLLWNWHIGIRFDDIWPISRLIPVHRAGQIAYDKLHNSLAAHMAERFSRDKDWNGDVRGYFFTALADSGNTRLWGKKPNSNVLREIPFEDRRAYSFSDNGQELIEPGSGDFVRYREIYMKRSDLKRRIDEIKGWG